MEALFIYLSSLVREDRFEQDRTVELKKPFKATLCEFASILHQ